MKQTLLMAAFALPMLAQQSFDFSSLDKLGANAKNKTDIHLDGSMLKLASGVLGSGKEAEPIRNLVSNLNGMVIRSYEFDKDAGYNQADLEPFRAFLKQRRWNRIVDSVEDGEHSEIYVQAQANNRIGGFAVISAEPREVTVIFIDGAMNMDDIGKLGGTMGIPEIKLDHAGKKAVKEE